MCRAAKVGISRCRWPGRVQRRLFGATLSFSAVRALSDVENVRERSTLVSPGGACEASRRISPSGTARAESAGLRYILYRQPPGEGASPSKPVRVAKIPKVILGPVSLGQSRLAGVRIAAHLYS